MRVIPSQTGKFDNSPKSPKLTNSNNDLPMKQTVFRSPAATTRLTKLTSEIYVLATRSRVSGGPSNSQALSTRPQRQASVYRRLPLPFAAGELRCSASVPAAGNPATLSAHRSVCVSCFSSIRIFFQHSFRWFLFYTLLTVDVVLTSTDMAAA